ncbi:MAG: hypothetical protein JWL86_2802 [Rhizobium sp.]|nr:hypothetical protein [Rhizobium sp.]
MSQHRTYAVPITSDMEGEMLALWDDGFDTDEIAKSLGCGVKEWQVAAALWRLREVRRASSTIHGVA